MRKKPVEPITSTEMQPTSETAESNSSSTRHGQTTDEVNLYSLYSFNAEEEKQFFTIEKIFQELVKTWEAVQGFALLKTASINPQQNSTAISFIILSYLAVNEHEQEEKFLGTDVQTKVPSNIQSMLMFYVLYNFTTYNPFEINPSLSHQTVAEITKNLQLKKATIEGETILTAYQSLAIELALQSEELKKSDDDRNFLIDLNNKQENYPSKDRSDIGKKLYKISVGDSRVFGFYDWISKYQEDKALIFINNKVKEWQRRLFTSAMLIDKQTFVEHLFGENGFSGMTKQIALLKAHQPKTNENLKQFLNSALTSLEALTQLGPNLFFLIDYSLKKGFLSESILDIMEIIITSHYYQKPTSEWANLIRHGVNEKSFITPLKELVFKKSDTFSVLIDVLGTDHPLIKSWANSYQSPEFIPIVIKMLFRIYDPRLKDKFLKNLALLEGNTIVKLIENHNESFQRALINSFSYKEVERLTVGYHYWDPFWYCDNIFTSLFQCLFALLNKTGRVDLINLLLNSPYEVNIHGEKTKLTLIRHFLSETINYQLPKSSVKDVIKWINTLTTECWNIYKIEAMLNSGEENEIPIEKLLNNQAIVILGKTNPKGLTNMKKGISKGFPLMLEHVQKLAIKQRDRNKHFKPMSNAKMTLPDAKLMVFKSENSRDSYPSHSFLSSSSSSSSSPSASLSFPSLFSSTTSLPSTPAPLTSFPFFAVEIKSPAEVIKDYKSEFEIIYKNLTQQVLLTNPDVTPLIKQKNVRAAIDEILARTQNLSAVEVAAESKLPLYLQNFKQGFLFYLNRFVNAFLAASQLTFTQSNIKKAYDVVRQFADDFLQEEVETKNVVTSGKKRKRDGDMNGTATSNKSNKISKTDEGNSMPSLVALLETPHLMLIPNSKPSVKNEPAKTDDPALRK